MTQVDLVTGGTDITLRATNKMNTIPPELIQAPGGLFPLQSAAYEIDEYRIMSGWPVPVPDCDIRANVLVTGDGSVLGDRDPPTSLVTQADLRWVADVNYYDQTSLQWTPIQGEATPWQSFPENAPTLVTDYEYRIGNERFVDMTALNFDSDTADFMYNDLGLVMGGTSGYTVIMVVNPNSMYGNDPAVIENALWGPSDVLDVWISFSIRDQAVYCTTESTRPQKSVSIGNALGDNTPAYLALVVSRPQTAVYAASGPSNVRLKSLALGPAPVALSTSFWLGNSAVAGAATVDMMLLDLGIYANPLSKSQVAAEFAALSTVYGGDT